MLSVDEFSVKYQIDTPDVEHAFSLLNYGSVRIVGFSGKMASGKDVAIDTINNVVDRKLHVVAFGDAVKREVSDIMARMALLPVDVVVDSVSREHSVSTCEVKHIVDVLAGDVSAGRVDCSVKTDTIRQAMQFWGTDVKRSRDGDYWVRVSARDVVDTVNSGRSVAVSDIRFVNEATLINDIGGFLVRLNVSDSVQLQRSIARDGTVVTDAMRQHLSETMLDSWSDFDVIIDTDSLTPVEVGRRIVVQGGLA